MAGVIGVGGAVAATTAAVGGAGPAATAATTGPCRHGRRPRLRRGPRPAASTSRGGHDHDVDRRRHGHLDRSTISTFGQQGSASCNSSGGCHTGSRGGFACGTTANEQLQRVRQCRVDQPWERRRLFTPREPAAIAALRHAPRRHAATRLLRDGHGDSESQDLARYGRTQQLIRRSVAACSV